jgi:UDP-N-acetylmuramoyl-L-alanyl-D-glutamate--2,6-diaminopimelate ligase
MRLKKLFKDILHVSIRGSKEVEITGICANSQLVSPGNLFIARNGQNHKGSDFIPQAIESGALAVVTDIFDPFLGKITQIICDNIDDVQADIAAKYYQYPSTKLLTIGITGTNGKTTNAYLIKHLLDSIDMQAGLIGTIENIIGTNRTFATHTTPDCVTNQKLLKEMILANCKSAVMEVTSHGLDQNRVENIDFDIAVFTNLTQDHLDYHQSMENYFNAKLKLFTSLNEKSTAIINLDDKFSEKIIEKTKARVVTFGIEKNADVMATNIKFSKFGTSFNLVYLGKEQIFHTPLVGKFNVYNILSAICVGIVNKIDLSKLAEIFQEISQVKGRLQKVIIDKKIHVFLDYAHTPDALINVLNTLKKIKAKKIITVFGCGGNRDKGKRPKMARAVEKCSDFSIITSDNPRSEDPKEIIDQIVLGFSNKFCYIVEEDRKQAIEKAIKMASEDDIVLIAGKGHETKQIFASKTIAFDDAVIIKNCKI